MKIIATKRQTGKTTKLIKMCGEDFKNGHYSLIVTINPCAAKWMQKEAKEMGYDIPLPITYAEFVNREFYGKNIHKFYLDEVGFFLERCACGVEIDTITFNGDLWEIENGDVKNEV